MILCTKFQAKRSTFGCTTVKSYLADVYSHSMIHQCFTCILLKNCLINFIFWKPVLIDFRQIIFKIIKSCKKIVKTIITFWVYH